LRVVRKFLLVTLLLVLAILLLGSHVYPIGFALNFGKWWYCALLLFIALGSKSHFWRNTCFIALSALVLHSSWQQLGKAKWEQLKDYNKLKIVSANVYFKNLQTTTDVTRLIETEADILCLQEYGYGHHAELGKWNYYPYAHKIPSKTPFGCAILSKYPISDIKVIGGTKPVFLICRVEAYDRSFILINAHLTSPAIAVENPDRMVPLLWKNYQQRKQQVEELEEYLKTFEGEAMVLAGDLNTMPSESLFKRLEKNWVDVHNATRLGLGYSFPNSFTSPFPITRLDYMMVRGAVMPIDSKIIKSAGSDHHFLLSEIGI